MSAGVLLNPGQRSLAEAPLDSQVFLEGPAGSGKTTTAVARLLSMVDRGVPGDSVLIMVPQRTLHLPFYKTIRSPMVPAGSSVNLLTLGGLARRFVQIYWLLVSEAAGFSHPEAPPNFLNLESSQYYMAHLVSPLFEEGLFSSVHIHRNRLYSQIIDAMNKSALVGFPLEEIGHRLKGAWVGEPGQLRVYEDVQACASKFRSFCLTHNLVDFSLLVEIFVSQLWPMAECQENFYRSFRHLIFDNLEEDAPVVHELVSQWLDRFDSALLVCDIEAGFRIFLGADPTTAYQLKDRCNESAVFHQTYVNSMEMLAIGKKLSQELGGNVLDTRLPDEETNAARDSSQFLHEPGQPEPLLYSFQRFFPQMLDWVAGEISRLVQDQGFPAEEIVVLSPYLSDSLRFALSNRLQSYGIASHSNRPSRSLREEPATGCLLTLAALAYPDWGYRPKKQDVVNALMQAIDGFDLVRAGLLADIVYRPRGASPGLTSFDRIKSDVRERVTYRSGERYERLRLWLEEARQQPDELDFFLSRLFGEVLSQPGYGFHRDYDSARVAASLIESVRNFRWSVGPVLAEEGIPLGKEYLRMVQEGVIAAQYLHGWQPEVSGSVLLAPAYTFVMSNRPVSVQFWLDIGSQGWSERLYQPLTHPYVLSRNWEVGRPWTEVDELAAQDRALYRLALGLVRRCRERIYLGLSEVNERGFEQRGPLLRAFSRLLASQQRGAA